MGQLGWHPHMRYLHTDNAPPRANQKYMSMRCFLAYCFHIRLEVVESNHLFLAGKLFQQFVCETWAIAEQQHLHWTCENQAKLRVEVYCGLADAVAADVDADPNQIGRRFVLPSSFSGSTCNMQQHCQDALAINCHFRGGDLFITMTANPEWPEIKNNLLPGQTASDHPDLVSCVFHCKLKHLIHDIYGNASQRGIYSHVNAYIYTIEFQKRSLPHAHIIIFLHPDAKLRTPDNIDSLMSSEFPTDNPNLLEHIQKYMVHNPCGAQNPRVYKERCKHRQTIG